MALSAEVFVQRALLGARGIVGDDGQGALVGDGLTEVVGGVGYDDFGGKTLDEGAGLS
jgi:hypothetical protein